MLFAERINLLNPAHNCTVSLRFTGTETAPTYQGVKRVQPESSVSHIQHTA